jgi:hypothetical protein
MKADVPNITEQAEYSVAKKWIQNALDNLKTVVNSLTLSDNFRARIIDVTFVANTDLEIQHGLGTVPSGYFLIRASVAMSIYAGSGTPTRQVINLRSDASGTATVVILA